LTEEINEACQREFDRNYNEHKSLTKCINVVKGKQSSFVSLRIVLLILFFVIGVLGSLDAIIYAKAESAVKEHHKLASKTELEAVEKRLNDKIKEVKDDTKAIKSSIKNIENYLLEHSNGD